LSINSSADEKGPFIFEVNPFGFEPPLGGDLMDYKQITKNDIKLVFQIVTKLKKEKRKREFLVLLFYGFIL